MLCGDADYVEMKRKTPVKRSFRWFELHIIRALSGRPETRPLGWKTADLTVATIVLHAPEMSGLAVDTKGGRNPPRHHPIIMWT
jgi:hypothetical protein